MTTRFDGTIPDDPRQFAEWLKSVCLGETTSEPWHAMMAPEHVERTHTALVDLKTAVMAALSRYQQELAAVPYSVVNMPKDQAARVSAEAKRAILHRREAMLRLNRSVDNHMREAKTRRAEVRAELFRSSKPGTTTNLRDRIRELEAALRLALAYVDPEHRDDPDIAQAHVVLEASGAWWHYAEAAQELKMQRPYKEAK